jgi:hypothetical protein
MNRITKAQKAIADRHINAKFNDKFDAVDFKTREELVAGIKNGKAYKELLDEIEIRFVNITSLMIGAVLNEKTVAYKNGVYKGFKIFLSRNGIE